MATMEKAPLARLPDLARSIFFPLSTVNLSCVDRAFFFSRGTDSSHRGTRIRKETVLSVRSIYFHVISITDRCGITFYRERTARAIPSDVTLTYKQNEGCNQQSRVIAALFESRDTNRIGKGIIILGEKGEGKIYK